MKSRIEEVGFRSPHRLDLPRLVHLHQSKLSELARIRPEVDEFLYALLLAGDSADVTLGDVGDLDARVRRIVDAPGPVADTAALCVAEAVETAFLRTRETQGSDAATSALAGHVKLLEDLEGARGISADAQASVRHHRAKALRRLGRRDEGIALCRALITTPRPPASTRLLLARLLLDSKDAAAAEEAGAQLIALLDESSAAPAGAELSVTLAAIEEFAAKDLEPAFVEAWRQHGAFISEQIVAGVSLGMAWAVEAFARIAARWEWHDPDGFQQLATRMVPNAIDVDGDDRQLAARSRILLAIARGAEAEQRAALLAQAVVNFKSMSKRNAHQTYELGKALVEAEAFAEAVALLEPLRGGSTPWLRHRLSQAYLGLGRLTEALELADELCAETPTDDKYYSTFRRHRFYVRRALGDASAVEDLRAALVACKDQKNYEQIAGELREARDDSSEAGVGAGTAQARASGGK